MGTNQQSVNQNITQSIPVIYYCDPGDIQRVLSIEGVKLKTQDYGKGTIAGESLVIEDAIWFATEVVNFYCMTHYDPAQMVKSSWVNRAATTIACWELAQRRANPAPSSLELKYKQTLQWLEQVHAAHYELPGVPLRATSAPAWSNVRIDQRYPTYRVRVERSISEKTPTRYQQSVDWQADWDYSI